MQRWDWLSFGQLPACTQPLTQQDGEIIRSAQPVSQVPAADRRWDLDGVTEVPALGRLGAWVSVTLPGCSKAHSSHPRLPCTSNPGPHHGTCQAKGR